MEIFCAGNRILLAFGQHRKELKFHKAAKQGTKPGD
jgi:hypothetical protein